MFHDILVLEKYRNAWPFFQTNKPSDTNDDYKMYMHLFQKINSPCVDWTLKQSALDEIKITRQMV